MPVVFDEEELSINELFDKMDSDFKKEHPVLDWINKHVCAEKGIAHYSSSHALTHPWLILGHVLDEIKYFFQRGFMGYDERVIWGIDSYLAKMLPVWIEKLVEVKKGVPGQMFKDEDIDPNTGNILDESIMKLRKKEYDEILQNIVGGFRAYTKIEDAERESDEYKKLKKEYEDGFALFKEYFGTLWD
jgi:hypothetical protein